MEVKIPAEELVKLKNQYYTLTETIQSYKDGMRERSYKKNFPAPERAKIAQQLAFFRYSIGETVKLLISHGEFDNDMLKHAVKNRSLSLSTRWMCLKILAKKPIIELANQF